MSLELQTAIQIALQQILLPGVFSVLGCWLLSTIDQGKDWYEEWYDREPAKKVLMVSVLGTVLCGLGMILSDFWQRELIAKPAEWSTWKASYQWQWMVWMIPGLMVLLALVRGTFQLLVCYTATAAIGFVCLNEGSLWEKQHTELLTWLTLSMVASIWNATSLCSIATSGGSRWVMLVLMGQFGCITAITVQSYGSLGAWASTGIGVSLGASLVSLVRKSNAKLHGDWYLVSVAAPLAIMAVVSFTVSRFFSESHSLPNWLVGLVLFLPTVVCIVDIIVGRLTTGWFRVCLAASACSAVLGTILYITKPWQSQW
jgi:hypothetical protein